MLLKASIFCSNLSFPVKHRYWIWEDCTNNILQRTKNKFNVWLNGVSKSIWALEVHLLTNCTIQAPWSCSLKINFLWRKNIKTLNFLILHKSNTKTAFWDQVFSGVSNVDPKVQGGIVLSDFLCDGRGAYVSQNLERKINLWFFSWQPL